jgi:hypothetical protein
MGIKPKDVYRSDIALLFVSHFERGELSSLPSTFGAQHTSGGSPTATSAEMLAMDCPPEKVKEAAFAPAGAMGTPSGTGTGSGIAARPSEGQPQRLEGELKQIESTRTERGLLVGDVKLWVQPSTAILVGCEKASTNDLAQGMQVKAAYEVKDGRNVARVIEAEKK